MFKPIAECMTVAELLEDPERWTKGAMAYDIPASQVKKIQLGQYRDRHMCPSRGDISSPQPQCFCVVGAQLRLNIGIHDKRVGTAIVKFYPRFVELADKADQTIEVYFNDHPDTTHEMVMAVVKEAGV